MFILDPNFFHPGSRIKKIPNPDPHPHQRIYVFLTQTIVSKLSEIDPGCTSRFRILIFLPIPDPGCRRQKKAPDPGSATMQSEPEETAAVRRPDRRCRAPPAGGRGAAQTDRRTDGARRRGSGSEPPSGLPGFESAPPSEQPPAGSNLW
jgi:hypothetical protein